MNLMYLHKGMTDFIHGKSVTVVHCYHCEIRTTVIVELNLCESLSS